MIREAIKTVSGHKLAIMVIDEHYQNFIGSLNEKDTIASLKKDIVKVLGGVDDFGILHDIMNRLYKENFEEEIDMIFEQKDLDSKTKKEFNEMFNSITGTFDDKKACLDAMKGKGILSGSAISGASTPTSMFSNKIMLETNPFIMALYERIKTWKAPLGAKSGVGAGEGLMVLFIKGGAKGKKGDVFWDGSEFEIKANSKAGGQSGGRLFGTDNNWGSTTATYDNMMKNIHTVANGPVPSDPNKLNIIPSTMNTWNDFLIDDDKAVVKFVSGIIKQMYPKGKFNWVKKTIKNGKFTPEFYIEFAAFQFQYYKAMENFNAVVFLNNATNKVLSVETSAQYKKFLKLGAIVYGGFSWKEARNLAYQVGLKG